MTIKMHSVYIPAKSDSGLFPVGVGQLRLLVDEAAKQLLESGATVATVRFLMEEAARAGFEAGRAYERNQAFVATVDVERMRAVLDEFKHSG